MKRLMFVAAILFSAACVSGAQSLGDVARAQRQKQQQKKEPAKVITDENMPRHDDPTPSANKKSDDSSETTSAAQVQRTGDEWKDRIQEAKEQIATAQQRLDEYKASIHFVEANRYTNGAQYNEHQAKKLEESERAQKQLDEAKQKLEDVQEKCRKSGFGSTVCDP